MYFYSEVYAPIFTSFYFIYFLPLFALAVLDSLCAAVRLYYISAMLLNFYLGYRMDPSNTSKCYYVTPIQSLTEYKNRQAE